MAAHLQVHPHFNAEEAAIAAAEFVQNLDNLPGEVNFLLSEIRDKDERITQLLGRINQRHYTLTKSVKNISSTTAPAQATFPLPISAGEPIPTDHLSTKDAQSVSKIQAEWGKIEQLQEDKIRLAERLERIVSRARERGNSEWRRVGGMDIDDTSVAATEGKIADIASADLLLPPAGLGSGTSKRNKKGASAASSIATLSAAQSPAGSMPPPPPPSGRGGSHARSGGSRGNSRAARGQSAAMSDAEAEAEAEMEVDIIDGAEVEADDQLYCFCQQKSFGEMVGCDNDKCKYEWFHIKCVNLTAPLPETWYCPDCVKSLGFSSSDGKKDRKGRKK